MTGRSLGSMLQGVSQQPARVRLPGQVTEQVNLVSAIDLGLSSRTGTTEIGLLPNASEDMQFEHLRVGTTDFILGFADAELRVWDVEGTEYTVNYEDTDAQDYVGASMRTHVDSTDEGDRVFLANTEVTVARTDTPDDYPFHVAQVTALGGNYARTYTVTLTFDGGVTVEGQYTTPDGSSSSHAAQASSSYIIEQLRADIAGDGSLPAGVTVQAVADVLLIKDDTPISVAVEDGEAGQLLRFISDTAEGIDDLPRFSLEGTIVKVLGDAADDDDYWLRFNADTTDTEGTGFGDQGTWEEWYDVTIANDFDLLTMPHVLTLDSGTGEFTLARGAWEPRRAGDDDSNPFPSFVGKKLADINGFEGRLVLVAGASCVQSRTKFPLDYFRKSATVLVASDPIDLKSSASGSVSLNWIIPFDRDLIILSDPGDAQFIIEGGNNTPDTASMVQTTDYEMFGLGRPATTGRTIVFPFKAGSFSGVQEFFTSDQVSTNGADTLTEVQQRYIVGTINDIVSSKSFNTILFTTNSEEHTSTVWVYKYLWEGLKRIQTSWGKWVLPNTIKKMFFIDSRVFFILQDTHGIWLVNGDMNKPLDSTQAYHVTMDRKRVETVSGSQVTLPYENALFCQSTGCLNEGRQTIPTAVEASGDEWVYTFNEEVAPDDALLICGLELPRWVVPTMPLVKDRNGDTISSAVITIRHFVIHLEDSGEVEAEFTSPYRPTTVYSSRRFPLDDEPLDPNKTLTSDDAMEVPWKERADRSELKVMSSNIRPTTILEIEWEGQVRGVNRR